MAVARKKGRVARIAGAVGGTLAGAAIGNQPHWQRWIKKGRLAAALNLGGAVAGGFAGYHGVRAYQKKRRSR